ncbi:ATP-binding cassette domain-containing protein, partial [Nocardia cyriacigeorgica]|uniref:ATP-binding cassette domain-containing protein n=1 Tax=Nocardia cyriacigeorgica TaxID=135487 RepID=UPI002457C251
MLEVAHLVRRFGDNTAVDDVSFAVAPGTMTGFVGANGAGKTTTMRMIMGVHAPPRGEKTMKRPPGNAEERTCLGENPGESREITKTTERDPQPARYLDGHTGLACHIIAVVAAGAVQQVRLDDRLHQLRHLGR